MPTKGSVLRCRTRSFVCEFKTKTKILPPISLKIKQIMKFISDKASKVIQGNGASASESRATGNKFYSTKY